MVNMTELFNHVFKSIKELTYIIVKIKIVKRFHIGNLYKKLVFFFLLLGVVQLVYKETPWLFINNKTRRDFAVKSLQIL